MTAVGMFKNATTRMRVFASETRASVSVDFIVSIPILLAVLVLTSEYGRVLQARSALDNAVADAARYLSRVPIDPISGTFSDETVGVAEALITTRLNSEFITISDPVLDNSGGFMSIQMNAAVGVTSPALGVIALIATEFETEDGNELNEIEGFVIEASETVRHFGR